MHLKNYLFQHGLHVSALMGPNKAGNERNIEARLCNHCCCAESNKCYMLWMCVCSLGYPACNAGAPYCHLWPAPLYLILPHYLINGTIFGERYRIQNMFWFFLQLCLEIFLIRRRVQLGTIIYVCRYLSKVPVI